MGSAQDKVRVRRAEDSGASEEKLTLQFIKDQIPPSCFERNATLAFAYLARDCLYAATLVWLALKIDLVPSIALRVVLWIAYGFLQGCVGTGLWIVGHECGHDAFSNSTLLNDIVGWAVHSSLLVPYFSWRITHARHHRYHNNMEKDTAFVPETLNSTTKAPQVPLGNGLAAWKEVIEDTPLYTAFSLLRHQLLGWPAYLLFYVTAGPKSIPSGTDAPGSSSIESHFDPFSSLWRPSQRPLIVLTDIGLILVGSGLYYLSGILGGTKIFLLYFVPYFWVHHWLVAITYLHHTHPTVVHYSNKTWSYLDGALGTVDRNFGFIGRHFFHNIIDYHVIHHLFTKIPFYHAEEATKAVMPVLGSRYLRDERPFLKALYETWTTCDYVHDANMDGIYHWVAK